MRQCHTLQSVGTTFGCTLGQILAHVARPQEAHTRLLRAIRDELMNIAAHHTRMEGDDARLLGYGLASCSVIRNERRKLCGTSLRVDTRYANGSTAIGACAAVIVTHAVLARFEPSAAGYFIAAGNLRTTLRMADERLSQWDTRHQFGYLDHESLSAERRALRRAHTAIDAAMSRTEAEIGTAIDRLQAQLSTATMAAYPPQRVGAHNEAEMQDSARRGAFLVQRTTTRVSGTQANVQRPTVVVPLSGIPQIPVATGAISDASSASWITATSSGHSDVSSEWESVEEVMTHTQSQYR